MPSDTWAWVMISSSRPRAMESRTSVSGSRCPTSLLLVRAGALGHGPQLAALGGEYRYHQIGLSDGRLAQR